MRLGSRINKLETKHGIFPDGEVDFSRLTDAEIVGHLCRLDPEIFQRWPAWAAMKLGERIDAILADYLPDPASAPEAPVKQAEAGP